MPYKTAFLDEPSSLSFYIDLCVDVLFGLDILVNFFSAYEEADGTIKDSFRDIANNYLRSWFFIDLIACIPF